jgi:hypothetical protein
MSYMMNYILKDKEAIAEPDTLKWCKWFENADRQIALDRIGDSRISTVFLGIDHSFIYKGTPILFETMIFGGKRDGYQARYCTWIEAMEGHLEMIKIVTKESLK